MKRIHELLRSDPRILILHPEILEQKLKTICKDGPNHFQVFSSFSFLSSFVFLVSFSFSSLFFSQEE